MRDALGRLLPDDPIAAAMQSEQAQRIADLTRREPPILARATGEGPTPEPEPSILAQACDQIAAWARKTANLATRVTALEARPSARDGQPGRDGVSITGIRLDDKGHLRVTIGGVENDLGRVVGERGPAGESIVGPPGEAGHSIQGERGQDGRGVTASGIDAEGRLVLTYTDGGRDVLARVVGRDGNDGAPGQDAPAISGASVSDDGRLLLSLTDGSHIDAGNVRGPAGPAGECIQGPAGAPGMAGTQFLAGIGMPFGAAAGGDLYLDLESGDLYRFKS